ncbi:MAG: spermidine/putrescine ABC transporter substrate-binding protein [Pegethrix bostrychoides GSE-TBD4-15B]|jgi:spermidine/putrescine transport system substrate-binding protein|uniref:Spermidine/putrescine ABC transporter substrate-binding protein n=1 Tax=Pegethrix bostrychoides GSE-TBD4-15B TaxID=2839662 RepID=A0A951PCL8_9CYAN|nr:spermidine/putrescine ABC transporter substrate-binding protein [Pegethrix bostrychoides GSE-TBD4-15B]
MPPVRNSNFNSLPPHSRRRFLQVAAAATSGVMLSNCARALLNNASGGTTVQSDGRAGSGNQTLRIYTWANYTDDELLSNFKDRTGIQVIADTYDSNETMLAKVQAGGGKDYSIIYPSDYMVDQMSGQGLLSLLDRSKLDGINQLMDKWQNPAYDKNNAHSIPAVWGTTGLIFNPDVIQAEVKGWDYIWDNTEDLTRQITMISDVREVLGATLQYLGYSINSTDPAQIKEAYEKLLEIKPAIASFVTNGWEDQLAGGDLMISMAYSQDAISLIAEKPELQYIVPESGSSLWTDTMVIPKTAPNSEAAYAWLNFMLEPENAARLVERLKISTPNAAAFDKLPPKLQQNENLFPSKAVLAKCEGIVPVKEEISNLYDQFWTRLTSS